MLRGSDRRPVTQSVCSVVIALFCAQGLYAHCDTMGGPVVLDAQRAIASGDPASIMKWIAPSFEAEIKDGLAAAIRVRALGDEARALADKYFLETVVRVHRAGEGAPYEGLKPAEAVPPDVAAADQALISGKADQLSARLAGAVSGELARRFDEARRLKTHADESPEAGRAFVAAYIEYVHFVEALSGMIDSSAHTRGHAEAAHTH